MSYYKKKSKSPFYQSPVFLATIGVLLLLFVATIGYQLGKTQAKPTSTPTTEHTKTSINLEDASASQAPIAPDTTAEAHEIIPAIIETHNASNAPIASTPVDSALIGNAPPSDAPINANTNAIIQSQRNSPVVWEMSQTDPTKARAQTQHSTHQAQAPIHQPSPTTATTNNPAVTIAPEQNTQQPPKPIGNQSVLHADDVPANEHASLDHLSSPTPPTIQPRVKIQSSKKDENGEPAQSLEIE